MRQAFEAMRCFIDHFKEQEPEQHRERFAQLIRLTKIEPDGIASDPAQWPDWAASVAQALGPQDELP